MHAMQFLAGIESLGFELDEIYFIGNHTEELGTLLKEHYNGQELGNFEDEMAGLKPKEARSRTFL